MKICLVAYNLKSYEYNDAINLLAVIFICIRIIPKLNVWFVSELDFCSEIFIGSFVPEIVLVNNIRYILLITLSNFITQLLLRVICYDGSFTLTLINSLKANIQINLYNED